MVRKERTLIECSCLMFFFKVTCVWHIEESRQRISEYINYIAISEVVAFILRRITRVNESE